VTRIWLSPPDVGPRERELLLDAFDSNWIAPLGPHVDAFERELAARVGVPHALALSSGTAALHLALRVLDVGPGDPVIVSSFTFAATANAVRYVGAEPIFVDSDRATWNLDPQLLAAALAELRREGRPARAVVVVDLYGQCAAWEPILEICRREGVPVIEDAAEALGATYQGRPAGAFGDLSVFSFNGNKIITTSGGGMLVSPNAEWIARARYLSTQARDPVLHYEHRDVGYNYRLSNLLAAVGRAQLEDLDRRVEVRRAHRARYAEALGSLPGVDFMPEAPGCRSTFWLTCLLVDPARFAADPAAICARLATDDIEARPLWKPMHLQPVFASCRVFGGAVSAELFARGVCLPSGSALGEEGRQRVIRGVLAARRPMLG
jgi:pyridoxal phosphate-dependent aminotransferase EpsN